MSIENTLENTHCPVMFWNIVSYFIAICCTGTFSISLISFARIVLFRFVHVYYEYTLKLLLFVSFTFDCTLFLDTFCHHFHNNLKVFAAQLAVVFVLDFAFFLFFSFLCLCLNTSVFYSLLELLFVSLVFIYFCYAKQQVIGRHTQCLNIVYMNLEKEQQKNENRRRLL